MKQQKQQEGITVFFSYAQADQAVRDQLAKHLSQLKREGLIKEWSDQQILAGADRAQEVDQAIRRSRIILLLISADFLASDACQVEMQQALERHGRGEARVIPLIVQPCDWQHPPLVSLQYLPRNGQPISSRPNQEAAFADVVTDIRSLIENLPLSKASAPGYVHTFPQSKDSSAPSSTGAQRQTGMTASPFSLLKSFPPRRWSRRTILLVGTTALIGGSTAVWFAVLKGKDRSIPIPTPMHPTATPTPPRLGITLRYYAPHAGAVDSVRWSPNGKQLAAASEDGIVRMWDASAGGDIPFTYKGHTGRVWSVAWSPDGKRLASSGADQTVQVWNVGAGDSPLFTYNRPTGEVYSVAWSPDSAQLASASVDSTVCVWSVSAGDTPLFIYQGHVGPVWSVAWSPNGMLLASASADKTVQVWDANGGGSALLTYKGHTSRVFSVAWSPDGKRLASSGEDQTVQVWDASTGSLQLTYKGHTGSVFSVAWSPDGKLLASASADRTVQVWDANTGSPQLTYKGHTERVLSVAWSPDGTRLASSGEDQTVRVWEG